MSKHKAVHIETITRCSATMIVKLQKQVGVSRAPRSDRAKQKDAMRRTPSGWPVQSFKDVLRDLATQCRNTVVMESTTTGLPMLTTPADYQRHVQSLLKL